MAKHQNGGQNTTVLKYLYSLIKWHTLYDHGNNDDKNVLFEEKYFLIRVTSKTPTPQCNIMNPGLREEEEENCTFAIKDKLCHPNN